MAKITSTDQRPQPMCIVCKEPPERIPEYVAAAREEGITPTAYVRREEGTLNPGNQHFFCTDCYIKIGSPSSSRGIMAA